MCVCVCVCVCVWCVCVCVCVCVCDIGCDIGCDPNIFLTLGVMTVFVKTFHWTAPSEVYSTTSVEQVFRIIKYYYPSDYQAM